MPKISLIHPSRSRPDKSAQTTANWISSIGIDIEWELIVSIDDSDKHITEYIKRYQLPFDSGMDIRLTLNDNKSVVEATNVAAELSDGDVLIYLSDDFRAPDNWGALVLKEFEGEERPLLLKVDDCLQDFKVPVLTIPIMNRALYEKLGYFWHPNYKSMFVDEDLYWTAHKLGALKFAEHLKFPHEHVSIGKAQDDETYRNSAKNWDQGKAVFAKRKAAGFPI